MQSPCKQRSGLHSTCCSASSTKLYLMNESQISGAITTYCNPCRPNRCLTLTTKELLDLLQDRAVSRCVLQQSKIPSATKPANNIWSYSQAEPQTKRDTLACSSSIVTKLFNHRDCRTTKCSACGQFLQTVLQVLCLQTPVVEPNALM